MYFRLLVMHIFMKKTLKWLNMHNTFYSWHLNIFFQLHGLTDEVSRKWWKAIAVEGRIRIRCNFCCISLREMVYHVTHSLCLTPRTSVGITIVVYSASENFRNKGVSTLRHDCYYEFVISGDRGCKYSGWPVVASPDIGDHVIELNGVIWGDRNRCGCQHSMESNLIAD